MGGRDVLGFLGRSWWLIGCSLLAVVGSSAFFAWRQTAVFEAAATVVIGPRAAITDSDEILDALDTLDRRSIVATYAKIPLSRTVQDAVQRQLELSPAQLAPYRIRTSVLPDTNILKIAVEGPDPNQAAIIANAVAGQAGDAAKRFYRLYAFKVLDPAVPPAAPTRPNRTRSLGAGTVLGLLLGVGLGFLRETGRRRVR
jgi:capsular polysaccharide biosynthesis protein